MGVSVSLCPRKQDLTCAFFQLANAFYNTFARRNSMLERRRYVLFSLGI